KTFNDFCEISRNCASVRFPAPGTSRSITNFGMKIHLLARMLACPQNAFKTTRSLLPSFVKKSLTNKPPNTSHAQNSISRPSNDQYLADHFVSTTHNRPPAISRAVEIHIRKANVEDLKHLLH